MSHTVAVIVGSLRRESFNRRLADALVKLAPEGLAFKAVEIGDLPLYNQDDDSHPHAHARRFKDEVEQADAILFVTPEYNRSVPGVLKNAIDHASRPYGQSKWAGKPAGVLGISIGQAGTSMAQQHLRNILAYLDMPTFNQPEIFLQAREGLFDKDGAIGAGSTRKMLEGWLQHFAAWVARHAAGASAPEPAAAREPQGVSKH
jgi:chromate reductase